jgi:hypothetical protein
MYKPSILTYAEAIAIINMFGNFTWKVRKVGWTDFCQVFHTSKGVVVKSNNEPVAFNISDWSLPARIYKEKRLLFSNAEAAKYLIENENTSLSSQHDSKRYKFFQNSWWCETYPGFYQEIIFLPPYKYYTIEHVDITDEVLNAIKNGINNMEI